MSAFRKKPVVIDATQWFKMGDHTAVIYHDACDQFPDQHCVIKTLEGYMRVTSGDWIITGVKGEHYPCKPDIFALTYEPADQPAPQGVADVMKLITSYGISACYDGASDGVSDCETQSKLIYVEQAITALVQERDALREKATGTNKYTGLYDMAVINALKARVAELEKDAARYQFWRSCDHGRSSSQAADLDEFNS